MRILPHIFLLLSAVITLFSCNDEADFSHDSNLKLTLSADSLLFEPLLTGQATSTRKIMVWNRSGEDLRIEQLDITTSNFQLNVDGKTGSNFQNIEVLNGDSLYIFVRANIEQLKDNKTALVEDSIVLRYNGNTNKVILSAISQNAVVLRKHTIVHDTTWTKEQPFLIFDTLTIANGAKLTIKAGTNIFMHNGASITIDGSLDIAGNASDPVSISGDRLDNVLTDIPYTAMPKQWGGICFTENSTDNLIEGLYMTGSTSGIVVDSAAIDSSIWRLVIANSELRTSKEGILYSTNARIKAYNTVFANGGNQTVVLNGGDYLFNFCTIAEIGAYAQHFRSALYLTGDETTPLTNATFNNCLVCDLRNSAVDAQGDDQWCNYMLNHSFVSMQKTDTLHYYNCVNEGKAGLTAIERYRKYDFHIDSTSAARNIANADIIRLYPECETDLDANPRTTGTDGDEQPDAGAFTYVSTEQTKE